MAAWEPGQPPGRIARGFEGAFRRVLRGYELSLDWALASKGLVMLSLLAVITLNVYLYVKAPKGFFPQQDTGQISGGLRTAHRDIEITARQRDLGLAERFVQRRVGVNSVCE